MSLPVTIENEALRMEVWATIGGKVSSVIDKADGYELLFTYPSEIPIEQAKYDRPYAQSWCVGWDELMPAEGGGAYPAFPYKGIAVPDHGELWGIPTTAVPSRNGITTVWHGLRFGYRLTRKLFLEANQIISEYALVNLSPFEFRFVWAQQALLSMKAPVEIELVKGAEFRFSHDSQHMRIDRKFLWPKLEPSVDLSQPAALPAQRSWKSYSQAPIAQAAVVRYPSRARRLRLEYSSESALAAYWGVWVNTGGWEHHRHLSILPTTGRFDEVDRAVADESAGRLAGLEKVGWTVKWTVEGI